jgi:hypothetical protein
VQKWSLQRQSAGSIRTRTVDPNPEPVVNETSKLAGAVTVILPVQSGLY